VKLSQEPDPLSSMSSKPVYSWFCRYLQQGPLRVARMGLDYFSGLDNDA